MNKGWWVAAAPLLVGANTPIDADTRTDLRCLIAVSTLAQNPDRNIALSGMLGSQYFFGRIDGRALRIDLEGALTAEAKAMAGMEMGPILKTCGAIMQERGKALADIGKRMEVGGTPAS